MLKAYTNMNTKLNNRTKKDFEKNVFQLMNNLGFGKTMENIRKHRDIRLVTTDKDKKLQTTDKKLLNLETKLSHNKMVFRKSTSKRNV